MSTRYNTGNPIESTDVRDMSDNAKNLDLFSNSSELSFDDRLGIERKTIHGMNSEFDGMIVGMNSEFDGMIVGMNSEFDGMIVGMNSEFDAQILNMGFSRVGTFLSGATLTNSRQTLLWDTANGGDGQEYGWSGAFPKVVQPSSTPASTGGISVGAWMSRFDPELRIMVRESLRRSYAEAGYNLVDGSFEAGGTLVNANDVLLQERTGKAFSGPAGTVAAGTNPASGGFVDKSGGLLRHELATSDGAAKVGTSGANGGSVQDFIDAQYTTVAELATGKFQVGQYVRLTDRGMGLFLVQSGGTADGYGVLDAGIGKTAQITIGGSSVNLEHLGAVNGQLSTSVMQYAADNYSAAYINGITLQCGEVDIPAKNFKFAAFGGGIVGVSGTYIFKQVKRGFLTEIDGVLCTGNSTLFTYVSDEASLPNHGQRYEYHITNCVLKQSTTLPAINLYGAREGLISGCFFEGNGGVLTEFTINTVVSNCQFKNCDYMVLSKLGSEGLNVSGAIALGCSYGIRAERTTGVIIANSIIDYCDAPVFLQGATDVMITNNYISTRTANPAINAVKYPDGFRGINHTINGNTIKDNHSTTGSACVRYQENDFVIITNNALGNYASNGIVYDNITQSMISNNTFRQRSGLGTNAVLALTDNETVAISENITGGKAISRTHTTSTWNNFGFKTEAGGEVSIPVGAATFDVTHGLAVTPSKSKVALQRTSVVNGGIQFYVSATSSTTFTITFNSPLTNVVTMAWQYSTR